MAGAFAIRTAARRWFASTRSSKRPLSPSAAPRVKCAASPGASSAAPRTAAPMEKSAAAQAAASRAPASSTAIAKAMTPAWTGNAPLRGDAWSLRQADTFGQGTSTEAEAEAARRQTNAAIALDDQDRNNGGPGRRLLGPALDRRHHGRGRRGGAVLVHP